MYLLPSNHTESLRTASQFYHPSTVNAGTDYRDLDPLTYPCMEAVRVKERLNDKVTEYKYTTTKMIWTLFDALNPEPIHEP